MAILKIALVLLILWFLYLIRDVIMIVFVAFVISAAISPWVDKLQKRRVPRVVSVIGIAVVIFGVLSVAIAILVPALASEAQQLITKLPELYRDTAGNIFSIDEPDTREAALQALEENLTAFREGLLRLTSGLFGALSSFFGGVAAFLTVLIIGFFMTVEEHGPKKFIQSLSPGKYQPYITQLVNKIQDKLGKWLRGQLLLSFIIFIVTYIGLTILGVRFALVLALFAGIFELIPFIGPIIAAIPAVFFAATESGWLALFVVILYVVVQQLENNFLVPKVMQQTTGLHPIVIMIAFLIGARLAGFLGVVLAVPVATIVSVFVSDLFEERRARQNADTTSS